MSIQEFFYEDLKLSDTRNDNKFIEITKQFEVLLGDKVFWLFIVDFIVSIIIVIK